jgi:hypothetical protein
MSIERKDVISVLGPIDEATLADVIAIDPTQQELVEAWAWVNSDGALIDEGRHLPTEKTPC